MFPLRRLIERRRQRNADMRRRREARAERAVGKRAPNAPLWMAHKPALPELCYPVCKN